EAHARAMTAGTITHYRCHAGLQCFAMPVEIEADRRLVVIGGRAFGRSSDYRELAERFRSGDLQDLESEETFQNVIFADESDLDHAALRLTQAASTFLKNSTQTRPVIETSPKEVPTAIAIDPKAEEQVVEELEEQSLVSRHAL